MRNIQLAIEPDRIDYRWTDKDGKEHHNFNDELALALLLINDEVFTNSYWWKFKDLGPWNPETRRCESIPKKDATWTEEESKLISVHVNCNDIFAWGCADSEDLPHDEIENLYRMWRADPTWGSAKWCAIRRKQKPQGPVIKAMQEAGAWDSIMENLGPNTMDAEVQAYFKAFAQASLPTKTT